MTFQLNLTTPVLQLKPFKPVGQYIEGTDNSDFLQGGFGNDVILGWNGNDIIQGGNGNDWLSGGKGNDWLFGGAGNDRLAGNRGSDYMAGGTGNDEYLVQDATDIVFEAANEGIDTVFSSISYTLGDNVENLTLVFDWGSNEVDDSFQGDSRTKGFGNQLNNRIEGDVTNNLLDGKAGNDTLYGGKGNDDVFGGTGSDIVRGNAGNDMLVGYGGAGTWVTPRWHQAEIDTLSGGTGADTFVLANAKETFYTHSRSAYAVIEDFQGLEGDVIQLLAADQSAYVLDQSKDFGLGSGAADTAIYKGNDLVAILQDTTTFSLTTDVSYVSPIAPPR